MNMQSSVPLSPSSQGAMRIANWLEASDTSAWREIQVTRLANWVRQWRGSPTASSWLELLRRANKACTSYELYRTQPYGAHLF